MPDPNEVLKEQLANMPSRYGSFCSHETLKPKPLMARPALVPHRMIFEGVLNGTLKLTNDQEATVFASWKVGGQDFYIYATPNA